MVHGRETKKPVYNIQGTISKDVYDLIFNYLSIHLDNQAVHDLCLIKVF